MIQIRRGVFETNSSSTHTITICTKAEYEDFKQGRLLVNPWEGTLSAPCDIDPTWREDYYTYEQWCERDYLEGYEKEYTTPGGEKIVAFGEYGFDG